jgi:hypothetical protein
MNEVEIVVTGRDRSGPALDSAERGVNRLSKATLISRNSMSGLTVAAMALGPALLPTLAVGGAAAAGLATTLASAGAAAGVFGAVMVGSFDRVHDVVDKVRKAEEKLAAADTAKERVAATKELAQANQALVGPVGTAAKAFMGLQDAWSRFLDQNQTRSMGLLTKSFDLLAAVIPKLQPLFDVAADAAGRFLAPITGAVKDGSLDKFVKYLADRAGPALDSLGHIVGNVFDVIKVFFSEFDSYGQGFLSWIEKVTEKWAGWAEGGGFGVLAKYVRENGPAVKEVVANIAKALGNLAQAITPIGPVSLILVGALAKLIAAVPPEVLGTIVAGFISMSVAIKAVTAAQAAWNIAMAANPIGIVVVAIAGLVGAFIYLWMTSQKFREIVTDGMALTGIAITIMVGGALNLFRILALVFLDTADKILGGLHAVASAVDKVMGTHLAEGVANARKNLKGFRDGAAQTFDAAIGKVDEWEHAFRRMPTKVRLQGEISDLEKKIQDARSQLRTVPKSQRAKLLADIAQFEAQLARAKRRLDAIKGKRVAVTVTYNEVVGSVVHTRRGGHYYERAHGGVVGADAGGVRGGLTLVGERGPELVRLPYGSTVIPNGTTQAMMSGAGGASRIVLELRSGGTRLDDLLVEVLRNAIRVRGGDVQVALGR